MENPKSPKEISNKSKTDIDNSKIIATILFHKYYYPKLIKIKNRIDN